MLRICNPKIEEGRREGEKQATTRARNVWYKKNIGTISYMAMVGSLESGIGRDCASDFGVVLLACGNMYSLLMD